MTHLNVRISPSEFVDAWRQQSKRLLLLVPRAVQLRDRVAVKVDLAGRAVHALVVGTVVSVHAAGGNRRIELAPDIESLGAVRMLHSAAKGDPVRFQERPSRYLVKLPVAVATRTGDQYMSALNLSEGGCSLRWSGQAPTIGQPLQLRLGTSRGKIELRGVVCWWSRIGAVTIAGVRFADPRVRVLLADVLAELAGSQSSIRS